MKFIDPGFLYALIALAIPLIIHLFSFRRFKKIYFPNVRFLKEIKEETRSKARLKHLLVLAARLLALAFLVLAFAQPYIPDKQQSNKKIAEGRAAVSIFIDNSFSMDGMSEEGRIFDLAKEYATEIAGAFAPSDQYQLLTNDFEGRHQRLLSRESFEDMNEDIETGPSVRKLSAIIKRQKEALKDSDAKRKLLFVISDFQKTITDIDELKEDTNYQVTLLPVRPEQTNNLFIDSCWFRSPIRQIDQPEELTVRIRNSSGKTFENVPLKLTINGTQKAIASFNATPNAVVDTTLHFTTTTSGIHHAVISITDYPVTFDDELHLSYDVKESLNVLCIHNGDSSQPIRSLFGGDSYFRLKQVNEKGIDYSSFADQNLIILSGLNNISSGMAQELSGFMKDGGSVLVFPGSEIDLEDYRMFLQSVNANYYTSIDSNKAKVAEINLKHRIFQDVFEEIPENIDLPVLHKYYRTSRKTRTNEETILKMQNGEKFLSNYTIDKGKLYLSTTSLDPDFSNFPKHAIFVPALYNIAMYSQPENNLYYTLGENERVELNHSISGDKVFHVVNEAQKVDVIPEQRAIDKKSLLYMRGQIEKAGNFNVTAGNETITGISLNYNRKESQLETFTIEELKALLGNKGLASIGVLEGKKNVIGKQLENISRGKELWRHCIMLVLFLLGIEVLLLKFWK